MWHIVKVAADGTPRWTWRRYEGGKVVGESSQSFANMGQAILDAERHGFNSMSHRWEMVVRLPPAPERQATSPRGNSPDGLLKIGAPCASLPVMVGDPGKCIASLRVETEHDDVRLVVTLESGLALLMRKDGLTLEEAEAFGHGVEAALTWATPEKMKRVAAGELLVVTDSVSGPFNDGVLLGFQAAARGYWLPRARTLAPSIAH